MSRTNTAYSTSKKSLTFVIILLAASSTALAKNYYWTGYVGTSDWSSSTLFTVGSNTFVRNNWNNMDLPWRGDYDTAYFPSINDIANIGQVPIDITGIDSVQIAGLEMGSGEVRFHQYGTGPSLKVVGTFTNTGTLRFDGYGGTWYPLRVTNEMDNVNHIKVTTSGTAQLDYGSFISAASSTIDVAPNTQLSLNGPSTILGGNIVGGGSVAVLQGTAIISAQTDEMSRVIVDGSTTYSVVPNAGPIHLVVLGNSTRLIANSSPSAVISTTGAIVAAPNATNDGTLYLAATTFGTQLKSTGGTLVNRGTIRSGPQAAFSNVLEGDIDNQGELVVEGPLSVNSGKLFNHGVVNIENGGSLTFGGTSIAADNDSGVLSGGTWIVRSTTRNSILSISGAPITTIGPAAHVIADGALAITGLGSLQLVQGKLELLHGKLLNPGTMLTNDGTIYLDSNSELRPSIGFMVTANGAVAGAGKITASYVNSGTLTPGFPSAPFTVNGNYQQTASGVLKVGLAGLDESTGHGLLRVTGSATLSGKLHIDLVDGFSPVLGDTFRLVDASSTIGTPVTISSAPGYEWNSYISEGDLWLQLVKAGVTADYDGSGLVDSADFFVWRNSFGSTTDLAADGNHSGEVDAADYAIWRKALQTSGMGSTLNVPEPHGLVVLGCALVACMLGYEKARTVERDYKTHYAASLSDNLASSRRERSGGARKEPLLNTTVTR